MEESSTGSVRGEVVVGSVRFSDVSHPIVHVQFGGANATDEDVRNFLELLDGNLDRHIPYAILIETPQISSLSPGHRRALAGWVKRRDEELQTYCLAQAYVMGTVLGRMILRSIFFLQKPVGEYGIFADLDEAMVWSREVLERHGVT